MKIRAELFHANGQAVGQTDINDEHNSRLPLFCKRAENCISWGVNHKDNLTFMIIIVITTIIIITIIIKV